MEKVLKLYKYVDGVNDTKFPNEEEQVVVSSFRYDAKRMGGAPLISCTVMHNLCLDKLWTENVYATFNGERFFIKQVPTSSYDNTDARYKHELELVSERILLDNVYFYDVVDSGYIDDKPVSHSSKFTFFGDIHEFVERLNQSLNYSKVEYSVVVDDDISSEAKMLSFQDQFFSNVLQEIYNTYEIPYYFVGKVIHIGFTDNAITHTFKYGQDESLLSIQKQNANYKVVNRVTGVGSADNIPYYYPNDSEYGDVDVTIAWDKDLSGYDWDYDAYGDSELTLKEGDIVIVNHQKFAKNVGNNEKIISYAFQWRKGSIDGPVVNLSDIGVKMVNHNNKFPNAYFYFSKKVVGRKIPTSTNLLPSIYRETLGKERFYNAINETYIIPGSDEYYEFENPYTEGKPKEHIVNFDSIKPTIKGITNANGQRIDMFQEFAYDLNDNDEVDEEGNYLHPYFFAKLRKFDGEFGFNLFEHSIDEEEMTVSMTSGSCGACEFVIGVDESTQKNIVQVDESGNLLRDDDGNVKFGEAQDRQNDTINNEVWIALRKDIDTFGVIMPNATSSYKPSVNDTFVILHIDLPKSYILAAEDKLKEELIKYMAMNNSEKFNFSISFSRIFFAENPTILTQLNENARIQLEYDNTTYELYVSSYSYAMSNDKPLPEIRVELSDTLTISQNALQTAISEVKQDVLSSVGSIDVLKQGLKYFLRKDKPDTAKEKITFEKGVEVGKYERGTLGTGGAVLVDEDGNSVAEFDFLKIRKKASFTEITVQELKHVGGEMVLSPAAMVCSRVEELSNGWKCFFNQTDSDGNKIENEFRVNDQARCQTFNLENNTYYWRLVTEVGKDYIVLSKTDCDKNSDVPKAGDNISQLGNRTSKDRQAAIVLSAYSTDAPSYKQYKDINSYSLEGCLVTKLSPNGNELTGKLNIETGSSGWENLSGLPENIQEAVDLANKAQETIDNTSVGAVNLLRNSGFTGDYLTEDLTNKEVVDTLSEMYSKQLIYWDGEGSVSADSNAVSGYSVKIGNLSQTVSALISKENYVISFKAKGTSVSVACGGFSEVQALTTSYKKYSLKFAFSGSKKLTLSGDATLCDIQLERGTIATDWGISPLDNEKAYSEFLGMSYMYDAIKNGATSILGGLILSTMMQLGNYKKSGNNMVGTTTAGVSGIYNNEDDVAFWGGGTYEQAIKTVMKFKENPRYKPTAQEWLDLANYVVTHGGDAVYRGLVFADGGYFRGAVDIANGKILLDDDGSGHFANKAIRWTSNGIMYRRSREILEWINVMTFPNNVINYDKGTLFDMRIGLSTEADATYTLETPSERGFTISVGLAGALSRSMQSAILSGSFSVITYSEEDNKYVSVSCNKFQLDFKSNIEYQLTWMGDFWEVRGGNASVKDGVATMGGQSVIIVGGDSSSEEGSTGSRVVISETEVKANKVTTNEIEISGSIISKGNFISTEGAVMVERVLALMEDDNSINTVGGIKAIGKIHTDNIVECASVVASNLLSTTNTEENSINTQGGITSAKTVNAGGFSVGSAEGIDKTVEITATDGKHSFTFTKGLLTAHSFTANSTES